MASSSLNVSTLNIANNELIAAALTCPVCLELCKNPKILPQCGHSLCAICLEPIYKKCEIVGKSVTTFPCPECRAENSVPTGQLDKLKVNYPVMRAIEALGNGDEAAKSVEMGESCPHAKFLPLSNLSTCQHCDQKFCKLCLFPHKELLKLEINFLSSGFHERFVGAQAQLPEKAEAIRRKIDENVRKVKEEIATSSEALIEALRAIILESRDRLSEKAQNLGDDLHNRLEREIGGMSEISNQQLEIDTRLNEINNTSILYNCADNFAQLQRIAINQDMEITKLKKIDASEVAKSNIAFTSDCSLIGKVTDLLEKASDVSLLKNGDCPAENVSNDKKNDKKAEVPYEYRQLHLAAKTGDLTKLKSIFSRSNLPLSCHRFIVEHRDKSDLGRTILIQAAGDGGSLDMVKYLVNEKGADIFAKDKNGDMAIHFAAEFKLTEIAKFLLKTNPQLADVKGSNQDGALSIASRVADLELVRLLVDELKTDVNGLHMECNWTPLMLAAHEGHLEIVKFLSERGADLLVKEKSYGNIALHLAAAKGHLEIVKYFLEKNPEIADLPNNNKQTPLYLASANSHFSLVEYLLKNVHRCNVENADENGRTPLLRAASAGSLEIVKLLVEHGANLLSRSGTKETILHAAACGGCVEITRFLLEKCPELLEMKNNGGDSVLHFATFNGKFEIVKCLVEDYKVAVDVQDCDGSTPLFCAVREAGRMPIVKFLIEHGANMNAKDIEDENLLHRALASNDLDLIAYLLDLEPSLVNKPDTNGETPLQAAKRLDTMKVMIIQLLEERAKST